MAHNECPKCGRSLQRFNGRIGYCTQHKWVSPLGLGFEAEAAEQNRLDAAADKASRLEVERQKAEEANRQKREAQGRAVRKAVVVVVALCLLVAAAVFFIVRPSVNYNSATDKFIVGDYLEAKTTYESLGNYKDAPARVLLCEAMIDLQEGHPEEAASKLDQLTSEGVDDIAKQLAGALLPLMSDWQAKGLSPQALLLLLDRIDVIDPDRTLDTVALKVDAHTVMLEDGVLSSYADDINVDGELELVALNSDHSATVYRMTSDGNTRMMVDNNTLAACGMRFGDMYKDADVSVSVACYAEAYRLLPNDETRALLAEAYRIRSSNLENAGDMKSAIADARSAMETSGAADDFMFFYDVNLRNCKHGRNSATAIALWEDFGVEAAREITRFGAQNRWEADAALLHIVRATELAAQKNEGCIAELRQANDLGGDVTAALAEVRTHFEPGLVLAQLRLFEMDIATGNNDAKQQTHAKMSGEVRTAISEWKERGIEPGDVPVLIRLADEQGIDLAGINRDSIYENATRASIGPVTQSIFVNWDHDDYKELLALDATGKLSLYGLTETWNIVSSINTKLPSSSYSIADESAPLILVLSSGKDELLALTGTGDKLNVLFREENIARYKVNGPTITFSKLLGGSIERYNDYTYEAIGTGNRPIRTGIDWQQNDYPQPSDAAAAIQRYFEARAYDIPDEVVLLTAEPVDDDLFSASALAALAVPDMLGTVTAMPYMTEDESICFEVTYPYGSQLIRTWVESIYKDGWKVAGAANTYGNELDPSKVDFAIPLISLNAETSNTIAERGGRNTYRILVPEAGSLSLIWQAGDSAVSRTSYTVNLYRETLSSEAIISYELQPNPSRQQSKSMFMAPGVYYITVEARTSNAPKYRLMMVLDADPYVELENNDTPANATSVEMNTAYSGSLLTSGDVDFYAFTLDQTSMVNVTLSIPGSGSKTTTHLYNITNAASDIKLSSVSVPGNAQLAETGNLYLSAGTYLIQLSKGSAWSNDAYRLTVNVSQDGVMEAESNDTLETATAVPVNVDIHASIGQEGDIDCFSFTLEGDAVVQPRFTFAPTDSSSKTYVLTLLDSSRYELLKVNIGGKESTKVIAPVALPAGMYFVRVENPRFIRQDYTLHLACIDVSAAEEEPNDTAALATELAVGSPRTGVLSSESDIDYYKLIFAEEETVTLRFSFSQGTNRSAVYVLSIEQNGKTLWSANVAGDSGGVEQQLQFPAGEYYLRVKPSTWMSMLYIISID